MKKFIHLSELQFFANAETSILFLDGSLMTGFNSINEANKYCLTKNLQYLEIVNKFMNYKY